MRDVREPLHLHVARHVHGARLADAREVVAAEVDEHHVLGSVLLRGKQPLDVALGRLGRAGDRAVADTAVLAGDEPLGRGADERDPVELEQEEVGRGVHAPQGAVDVERRGGGRPLGALRRDALEDVAGHDVLLHVLAPSRCSAPGRASGGSAPARAARLAPPGDARLEPSGDLLRIAGQHLGGAGAVVEADERLADDEAALGEAAALRPAAARSARAVPRGRTRGSRRSAAPSSAASSKSTMPRAGAHPRVPAQPPALDRLEDEARAPRVAQAQVGAERGEEVGVDRGRHADVAGVVLLKRKRPPQRSWVGEVGLSSRSSARSRIARGATTRSRRVQRSSS